jgi:uncharacterized protein YecE (DUF72 family)
MGNDDRMLWVGTSGWHYRDWIGRFYPEDMEVSAWLRYYAERFSTVELNNSFYRLPERTTFESWARQAPEGFVMAVKASRYLTHIRRLREPDDAVARLWSAAEGLGSMLGPVLFQFPPSMGADVDRLRRLLEVLPGSMRAAFEFRHASWFTTEVYDALDRAGAALVWADAPGRRLGALPMTGKWAYVRFHRGRRTAPGYRRSKLARWADRLAGLDATDVFAYFNNDAEAAAVHDASLLGTLLEQRGVHAQASRYSRL